MHLQKPCAINLGIEESFLVFVYFKSIACILYLWKECNNKERKPFLWQVSQPQIIEEDNNVRGGMGVFLLKYGGCGMQTKMRVFPSQFTRAKT